MKKMLLFLAFCLCTCASNGQTAEVPHYVEFARSYGVIRYFSPNPYTQEWSESDWMKVCALLANKADTLPLEEIFEPLAPTLSFTENPMQRQEKALGSDSPAGYCYYSGAGKLDVPFLANLLIPGLADYIPYYKKLSIVPKQQDSATIPLANRYYSYPVGRGKYLNIQHALPKEIFDDKATRHLLAEAKAYWKNHQSDDKTLPSKRRFIFGLLSDRAVRIADLTVRWNMIRHFYPYYEEDNLNWDYQLESYLRHAIQMEKIDSYESLIEWYDMICRFLNPIKDGHLFVRRDMEISTIRTTYLPEYHAAVETKIVHDTLLIRAGSDGKQPWRVLHTIDNRPATERLQYCRRITNAATEAHRDKMAADKLFSSSTYGTQFVIGSSNLSGESYNDTLYAQSPEPPTPQRGRQPIRKYGGGILYIDATSPELNEKRFLAAVTPDIKRLCFDLRGLPSHRFEDILAHLIASDATAPATEVPVNCFPFQQNVSWRIGAETLQAKLPHIALPATFLCDAGTVSWGETILLMVRHYRLGEIIGQTTAGTTGDMTLFDLPLFPFSMTAMRMHGMDGERHHARGVVPDKIIPVYASDYMTDYDRTLHTAIQQ